jgi:hypothetical protein
VPELGSLGSVRGAQGNLRPYRETLLRKWKQKQLVSYRLKRYRPKITLDSAPGDRQGVGGESPLR